VRFSACGTSLCTLNLGLEDRIRPTTVEGRRYIWYGHSIALNPRLLDRVFPEAYRQMVTIVINPKGVTQSRFSRVEEYAFFFLGESSVTGFGDDLLSPGQGIDEEEAENPERQRPRWKGLAVPDHDFENSGP
jgi:hypothetical protein